MAEKLPWFKFYAQDWLTDPRVLRLTNEQRGIYLWLLCRQWHDGALPYDVHDVYPLLPPGSESAAVAYVLTAFFPPDPDTNERRNTRLAEQQEERASAYQSRVESAGKARKARARKSLQDNAVSGDQTGDQGENQKQNQKVEPETAGEPEGIVETDFVTQCVIAANLGLRDNPAVNALEAYKRPLTASKARDCVEGWLGEGIPESVILAGIQVACQRFQVGPGNTTIGSFRYFDGPIRRKWAETQSNQPLPDALFAGLK